MKIVIHTEYELPKVEHERKSWIDWWIRERCPAAVRKHFVLYGFAKYESKDPTSSAIAITTYALTRDFKET
jgi:hypothetical protein